MKDLLSAREIAELKIPDLPTTKVGISSRALNEGWYFEERTGLGGVRRVYKIPSQYLKSVANYNEPLPVCPSLKVTNNFIERMQVCAEMAGSVNALAKIADLSQSTVRRYLEGGEPGRPHLVAIAKAVNVDLNWLATGEDTPYGPIWFDTSDKSDQTSNKDTDNNIIDSSYAAVPIYDISASAGHGADVGDERISDSLIFKKQWIHQELNAQPNDLYLIHLDGESMEPTLRPGDVILVDRRSAQSVPRDGIYVIRMDGSLLVKRLQRLPGRKVKVSSDNPAYEPFELQLDSYGEDLAIIGVVVWSGRRM